MDTALLVTAFGALFAIMNPFLQLPMFLALTEGYDPARQRRAAVRSTLYSALLCLVVLLTGSAILGVFGIKIDDFRLAGGIVLLMIALGMLNGRGSTHEGTSDEQKHQQAQAAQGDISFYPMAFPMVVGPGTITTIVLLSGGGVAQKLATGLVLAALLLAMLAVLWFAPAIGRHLSMTLRTIMTRLMGMILAAIAVQMVVTGLQHVFPALVH